MVQLLPDGLIPQSALQPKFPKLINSGLLQSLSEPEPTPAPEQIPTLVPYPVPTEYPTYTYSPPAVQITPQVQKTAIDPAILLVGGLAVIALFLMAFKK